MMQKHFMQRLLHLRLIASLAVATAGCGTRTGPDVQYVEGVVLSGSKPVEGAFVHFHPASGGIAAAGVTTAGGSFRLTSDRAGRRNAGAVAGAYKVTIYKLRDDNPPPPADLPANPGPNDLPALKPATNLLPEKYRSPGTSGLEATVTRGRNTFRFELD